MSMTTLWSLLLLGAPAQMGPIEIRDGLVIGGVVRPGRNTIPSDAIVDLLNSGKWTVPTDGSELEFQGKPHKWKNLAANKDGVFESEALEGGYFYTTVNVPSSAVWILSAPGSSMVYVNGVPRGGDVYSNGSVSLPVSLKAGQNELLIPVGRGELRAKLTPPIAPVVLTSADQTLPDVIPTDRKELWGAIMAVNSTSEFVSGQEVIATLADGTTAKTKIATLPPQTFRKVNVRIPLPKDRKPGDLEIKFTLKDATFTSKLRVRKLTEVYRRTFVSNIDGSVQYYAVNPSQNPKKTDALVLTVHGASVEAQGQAEAYGSKDWATIVAATNRRPYGFDWEDVGRLDALEVLNEAKRTIPHDPQRVHLTGHSMGGHGTWSIGTLYPDTFASINPSAGWISFWSYGGSALKGKLDTEAMLFRSMATSDTLARVTNTLAQGVYVLHGDADDNVPVTEARKMKQELEAIKHPDFKYHEQPGAGHWWGGQCVDWPPLFEMIAKRKLDAFPKVIDFTTPNPAASSLDAWVSILQQEHPLIPSRVKFERHEGGLLFATGTTQNVAAISIRRPAEENRAILLDGQPIGFEGTEVSLKKVNGRWTAAKVGDQEKNPLRGSPFKAIFNHRFVLVVGTKGTPEENAWAMNKARYDAESFTYRGNGSPEILTDKEFLRRKFGARNAILYGNATTNQAWKATLGKAPFTLERGRLTLGGKTFTTAGTSALILYPRAGTKENLVAVVGGIDLEGMKRTDRLPTIPSGVGYPDWTITNPTAPGQLLGAGFFGNDWQYAPGESAWAIK